jgi:hypothetical protein
MSLMGFKKKKTGDKNPFIMLGNVSTVNNTIITRDVNETVAR